MMNRNYSNFFKTSDGQQIFYSTNFDTEEKPKKVLVFNYGLVCSNFHWSKQIEYFDELGYKILLHDYRGHYQSSRKDNIGDITFEQLSIDLNELINFLNLEDIILLGHSMGVNVCLEYCKNHQENVKKMILISGTIVPVFNIMMDTHLTGPLQPILTSILDSFPKQFNTFWKYGGWNPFLRKIIKAGGFNQKEVSDEFIEVYMNKLGELGPELFFQLLNQMQTHDILSFVHNIKTKTLIIGGNKDKVIPNYLQRILDEKLHNSELYIIHKGSHVPQVDFPVYSNERIEFFLGDN